MTLEGEPDITVIGEAATGEEAVWLGHELRSDVILMDICMPRLDGIQATASCSTITTPRNRRSSP